MSERGVQCGEQMELTLNFCLPGQKPAPPSPPQLIPVFFLLFFFKQNDDKSVSLIEQLD